MSTEGLSERKSDDLLKTGLIKEEKTESRDNMDKPQEKAMTARW